MNVKTISGTIILLSLIMTLFAALPSAAAPAHFYVSPAGNDDWSGAMQYPNDDGSDGPLATLTGARNAIRDLKAHEGLPEGGALVWITDGKYRSTDTVRFSAKDSGEREAPVRFIAMPGDNPRITGGVEIEPSTFAPIERQETLERLPQDARDHVLRANMKGLGIQDFGSPKGGGLELFFEGRRMTLARWPNEGFVRITDVLNIKPRNVRGTKGDAVGKFVFESDRLKQWQQEDDLWMHGYWFWDWSDQRQPVKQITPEKNIIELEKPYHHYGYRKGQWFYAYNALCELDSPGEWYLDRGRGMLYFWPPASIQQGNPTVTVVKKLLQLKNTSHTTFQGLTFEFARGTAIDINGGTGSRIVGCTMRNLGGWAVKARGGSNIGVRDCDAYHLGQGGIAVRGGDRKSLTPANHFVKNNHIHHIGQWNRMYVPGVSVHGVGNIVSHNLIHDGPHQAVSFGGNDHIIEYNEMHSMCYESNDAGAMYSGRDWTQRGTQIRYNFLHHIVGREGHGCVGVYLDDMFCGTDIYRNVFYRVYRAAFIGGGRDNTIVNNIFVDCPRAIHIDARAMGWASGSVDTTMTNRLNAMPYKKPPWSQRYPRLLDILSDEPAAPKGNIVARNAVTGPFRWRDITGRADRYVEPQQMFTGVQPQFKNPEKLDFSLPDDSPLYERGFQPIPFHRIGLRKTPTRASWPVQHQVRPEVRQDWANIEGKIETRRKARKEIEKHRPTFKVRETEAHIAIDGHITDAEWNGADRQNAMVIQQGINAEKTTPISLAWLAHDNEHLLVAVENHVDPSEPIRKGDDWGNDDAVEIAVSPKPENGPIFILRGYPSGHFESSAEAGTAEELVKKAAQNVKYAANIPDDGQWNAEWRIPLQNVGLAVGDRVPFNISIRKSAQPFWQMWQGTAGHTWDLHYAGFIKLAK